MFFYHFTQRRYQWCRVSVSVSITDKLYFFFQDGEGLLKKRESEILSGLTLQGIVGIEDPVREQVWWSSADALCYFAV